MKKHISTQLRETQMQSYKCNESVCALNDIEAQINETHMHGNKCKIDKDACKCVCAPNLFKNQGQVIYLLKLLILKSPGCLEAYLDNHQDDLSYPLHTYPQCSTSQNRGPYTCGGIFQN